MLHYQKTYVSEKKCIPNELLLIAWYVYHYPFVSETVPSAPDRKDVNRSCSRFLSFVTIASSSLEGGG